MSGFTLINVGAAANDGNGDSLRVSQQAVNSNYTSTPRVLGAVADLANEAAAAEYIRIVHTGPRSGVYAAVETATAANGVTTYASATVGWLWVLQNFLNCIKTIPTTVLLASEPAAAGDVVAVYGSARKGLYLATASGASADGYSTFASATSGVLWVSMNVNENAIHGQIDTPLNDTYVLMLSASKRSVISAIYTQTDAGSLSASFEIGGVAVTGASAITATNTITTTTPSALNKIDSQQKLTMTLSSVADVGSLYFTIILA
jgi:hypothetical protein